jgi:DNA-binding IclR family transcriptional regulator
MSLSEECLGAGPHPLPLTEREAEVLALAQKYYDFMREGCPATYLARHLDMSRSTVRGHLEELHRKGWLRTAGSPAVPRNAAAA